MQQRSACGGSRCRLVGLFSAAIGFALTAIRVLTVRSDETYQVAWNGPSPPQYGWPLPWTAWNGVSSLEWILDPSAFLLDVVVYTTLIVVALFCGGRVLSYSRASIQKVSLKAVAVLAVVSAFHATACLFVSVREIRDLPTLSVPRTTVWIGEPKYLDAPQ